MPYEYDAVISGSIASGEVGWPHIADQGILSGNIGSGQIGPNHLGSGAVLSGAIASGQVGPFHLADGAVTPASIGSGAIVSAKIASGQIGSFHLADEAVTSGDIASGSISTFKVASGGLLSGALGSGQIGNAHLGSGAVLSGHIASGQIGPNHLGSGAVLSGAIASGQIGPNHLGSGAVTSGAIASGQIGINHLGSGAVRSGAIASGQIGPNHLGSGAVTSGAIASGQIGTAHLADEAVTSGDIASGSISTFKVASGGLLSGALGSGQVGNAHLGSGAVLSSHIGSGQVGNFAISSGAVTSGRLGVTGAPDGTKFLRDDFTWQPAGSSLTSGAVGSGIIASGAVDGFFGVSRRIQSGTVGVFDFGSGAVVAGAVGSGAIQSANIASGQVSQFKMASGAITSGHIGNLAVVEGGFASGVRIPFAAGNYIRLQAGETLFPAVFVQMVPGFSGTIRACNAADHSKMPAIGLVDDLAFSVASGAMVNVYTDGYVPQVQFGITEGSQMYVGAGGSPSTPPFVLSGYWSQLAGVGVKISGNQGILLTLAPTASAGIRQEQLAPDSVISGKIGGAAIVDANIASGTRVSFAGGGYTTFQTAEGWIGGRFVQFVPSPGSGSIRVADANDHTRMPAFGWVDTPGAVNSGEIVRVYTEGVVPSTALGVTDGAPVYVGSGGFGDTGATLRSGNFSQPAGVFVNLSGQPSMVLNFSLAFSGSIRNEQLASGSVRNNHIASGAVTSGRLGVTGTPDGTKVLRDDFTWAAPGTPTINSGDIGSGKIASGSVDGFFGPSRRIQSGTVGVFDFGSGAVLSGAIASGQVGTYHFASGAQAPFAGNFINYGWPTGEAISGSPAIAVISGGIAVAANPVLSGRMPAIAVAENDAVSGGLINLIFGGNYSRATWTIYGNSGRYVYVGNSGHLTQEQPTTSGAQVQLMGLCDGYDTDVTINPQPIGSGSIGKRYSPEVGFPEGSVFADFASGATILYAAGLESPFYTAAETLSGGVCVTLASGGWIFVSNPSNPRSMPAMGVLAGVDVLSGQNIRQLITHGYAFDERFPIFSLSGQGPIYVGNSGQPSQTPPTTSGAIVQIIGPVYDEHDFHFVGVTKMGAGMHLSGSIGVIKDVNQIPSDFASGAIVWAARGVKDQWTAGEMISGGMCVCLNSGGWVFVANPNIPSRMPALGVLGVDTLSGQNTFDNVISFGYASDSRYPIFNDSGQGRPIYVGESGQPTQVPPPVGQIQIIGTQYGDRDFYWHDGLWSGQIRKFHIASGSVGSGQLAVTGTPDGTKFLRDDFSWQPAGSVLGSGDVGSGKIASGSVDGFFGPSRRIQSGTVGVFDFGSGAVIAGTVGSGAVVSANIASGQIGTNHIGSGAIVSSLIASGQVGRNTLGAQSVWSAAIGSGQIGVVHLNSGETTDVAVYLNSNTVPTAAAITMAMTTIGPLSGLRAITVLSGNFIGTADASSGLRLPAIGVVDFNARFPLSGGTASGLSVNVVLQGALTLRSGAETDFAASVSGQIGPLWIVSGNTAAGVANVGRMTRTIPSSGIAQQRVAVLINAGLGGGKIVVMPGPAWTSGVAGGWQ